MNAEQDRRIDVGILKVDLKNKSAQRTDNNLTCKLTDTEITIIRILSGDMLCDTASIGKKYVDSFDLNKAMLLATSDEPLNKREKALAILDKVDKRPNKSYMTKECVTQRISLIRKKIGTDLIVNDPKFGYVFETGDRQHTISKFGVIVVNENTGEAINTATKMLCKLLKGEIDLLKHMSSKYWITTTSLCNKLESRDYFLNGKEKYLSEDSIRVRIMNLRKKIGRNAIIASRSRFGYHLMRENEKNSID